jgi:hypothetical protein
MFPCFVPAYLVIDIINCAGVKPSYDIHGHIRTYQIIVQVSYV